MHKRDAIRLIAGSALLMGFTGFIAACSQDKPKFRNIDITGADYARDFHLADQDGVVRTLSDFRGKVVVMFFGYTQCPDVCPTTMAELAEAKKALGQQGDKLQVLFVTVDPERDTPQVLKAYMANFDPTFLALRPTPEQLPELAKAYKVDTLLFTGVSTNMCVEHTMRDAASHGYNCFLVEDACGADSRLHGALVT